MSKLKNIIRQLSEKDFHAIYSLLIDSNADKSAALLKFLKERQLSDAKIMTELDVNPNAYYTLRSRLNEKIEEYLILQMDTPKTDILKRVSSINDIVFTKNRTITLATLKKLEKELIDYDLANELILVYKALKKLNIHTADHYQYSQLYNKHVAYTLAVDKAEDLLAEYFKKYGFYFLTGDKDTKHELLLLLREIKNLSRLYQSHRLFVYYCCAYIFHAIFIDKLEKPDKEEHTLEDFFVKIDYIYMHYSQDAIYHHLRLVFDALKMHYHFKENATKKAEKHMFDVSEYMSIFMTNYSLYTFPAQVLVKKMERVTSANAAAVEDENKMLFADYEPDINDIPKYATYFSYRAICYFHLGKHELAAKTLNTVLNEISFKRYPDLLIEIKTFLAIEYSLLQDNELLGQMINSIQRHLRLSKVNDYTHIRYIIKMLKAAQYLPGKSRTMKIKHLSVRLDYSKVNYFTPLKYIDFAERLQDM